MKIKLEIDVVHFMVLLRFLLETDKGIKERPDKQLDFVIFQEAFENIGKQFNKQYTDEMGDEFERLYKIRELLFNTKN